MGSSFCSALNYFQCGDAKNPQNCSSGKGCSSFLPGVTSNGAGGEGNVLSLHTNLLFLEFQCYMSIISQ